MNVSGKGKIARVVSDVNGNVLTRKKVEPLILKCKKCLVEDRYRKQNCNHQEDFVTSINKAR